MRTSAIWLAVLGITSACGGGSKATDPVPALAPPPTAPSPAGSPPPAAPTPTPAAPTPAPATPSPAPAGGSTLVQGNGVAKTEQRTAGKFTAVALTGQFDCEIAVGGSPSIEVTGDANLLPQIETTIDGDQLRVQAHGSMAPKLPLHVKLTTAALASFSELGTSKTTISGLAGDAFAVETTGTGGLTLAGAVKQLTAHVAGTALLDANQLTADSAAIKVDGVASMELGATKALAVAINGTGSVRYAGTPTVTKQIHGTGSVTAK